MRFVFTVICGCAGLVLAVFTAPMGGAQVSAAQQDIGSRQAANIAPQNRFQKVLQRVRGGTEKPIALNSLSAERFASQLGDISAATLGDRGVIYTADEARGRIYRITDRDLDGNIDSSRLLVTDMDRPSGLAVIDGVLFIADARAVWRMPTGGGEPVILASLANASAAMSPRPLQAQRDGRALILGLTDEDKQGGRIISVDPQTGAANLMSQGNAPVTALALSGDKDIWIGIGDKLIAVRSGIYHYEDGYPLSSGAEVTGLILPGQFADAPASMTPWQHHVLAAQGGINRPSDSVLKGFNVLATPTNLGSPIEGTQVFLNGFASENMRTAWGQPGVMMMDSRGLFVADRWSGSLWLVKDAPQDSEQIETPETPTAHVSTDNVVEKSELAPKGSGIAAGSTLSEASQLRVGSTIIKAAEDAAAEKKAKEEAEAQAKNPDDKRPN